MESMENIGAEIQKRREALGISRDTLSKEMYIDGQKTAAWTIQRIEEGKDARMSTVDAIDKTLTRLEQGNGGG